MATLNNHIFTPSVLHSYRRFEKYIDQNHSLEEIRQEAEATPQQVKGNLLERWQVAVLTVTSPFKQIYTIFLDCIRRVLFSLGLSTWAIQIAVHKRLWEKDTRLKTWETYGSKCLAFSANARAQNSWDAYLQPPVRVEDIRSERVRRLLPPVFDQLIFYKDAGCCRGMSEWFLYLYFKTQPYFSDSDAHMQAIGKQFENGASSEAVILQTMCHQDQDFLGFKHEGVMVLPAMPTYEGNERSLIHLFEGLDTGAYSLAVADHRLNYIRISEEKGYLFDSNYGTIVLEGPEGIRILTDRILRYFDTPYILPDGTPSLLIFDKAAPL